MPGKKRKAERLDVLSKAQLYNKISAMPKERDRALASFLYLTGMRISELLGMKKVIHHKGKPPEDVIIKPLTKEDIEIIKDMDLVLVQQVVSLKKRYGVPKRSIPIIISKEKEYLDMFFPYYHKLLPEEPLFKIKRQRAWQIMNKELGLYNHFLIHERCTHLVQWSNFNSLDLMRFRGWTDTKPAATYAHLGFRDLAAKMKDPSGERREFNGA